MQILDVIRFSDCKHVASVTSGEAAMAVRRLMDEPLLFTTIPFMFHLGPPRKNVIIDDLRTP